MPCQRYADALSAHALGAEVTPAVAAHLERCPECRTFVDGERRRVAAIDRDLACALAVEPSPDFGARLQARLARRPAEAPAWRTWWVPAALATATLAILIVSGVRGPSERRTLGPQPAAPSGAPPSTVPLAPAVVAAQPARPTPRIARAEPRRADTARSSARRPSEPEILVPPGQEEALRRFLESVRSGRVDASALVSGAGDAAPGSSPPKPLEIPSLTIEPLTVPTLDVGRPAAEKTGNPGRSTS